MALRVDIWAHMFPLFLNNALTACTLPLAYRKRFFVSRLLKIILRIAFTQNDFTTYDSQNAFIRRISQNAFTAHVYRKRFYFSQFPRNAFTARNFPNFPDKTRFPVAFSTSVTAVSYDNFK